MKSFVIGFLLFLAYPCFSQLGIHSRYQRINAELWNMWTNEEQLFTNGYEIGLDYWFRLKNYRIEFLPEIYAFRSTTSSERSTFRFSSLGLAANAHFYILDFIGDCDCPTFSKDGNLFTKGFYLSIAPLLEYQNKQVISGDPMIADFQNFGYGATIGAGVDFGVNDLITITPYVRFKFLPGSKWDTLALERAVAGQDETVTSLSFFQFGLRLGFRPDYVREQNKYGFR
ncbi:hypothetical protein [Portibacter marinus]|uniref:hypothetical protein n=1 Tax=Portibacter marinus TaxID=2898660 RepID=UPI001F454092|nr:hypothetical protein [Portibacter marinus]